MPGYDEISEELLHSHSSRSSFFIITIVTRLNEYAEIINLFTRILSGILVFGIVCIR